MKSTHTLSALKHNVLPSLGKHILWALTLFVNMAMLSFVNAAESTQNIVKRKWMQEPEFDAYALIVANREDDNGTLVKTMVVCGPDGNTMDSMDARWGRNGGFIALYDATTGQLITKSERIPSVPICDGMIANNKHLYIADLQGRVSCIGQKQ